MDERCYVAPKVNEPQQITVDAEEWLYAIVQIATMHDLLKRAIREREEAERERDEAHRLSALWEEKYHDAEVEIELMIVERDEARGWARQMKAERDEARANQIKSRCGDCLHWISIADECGVSGEERVESDYCSWWKGKQ